jgi:hypothetical protein
MPTCRDRRRRRVLKMEIELKATESMGVEVEVTVTPLDGQLPGPPGPRYRFLFSDDLARTHRRQAWETAYRSPRKTDLQAPLAGLWTGECAPNPSG